MSKRFRQYKKYLKSIDDRKKKTFGDYKKGLHLGQMVEKEGRKNFLKAKSMLRKGREYVFVGNTHYSWGEDKKYIIALHQTFTELIRLRRGRRYV